MPPAIIGGAIAAAGAVGGALIGSSASRRATNAQTAAADQANALQKYMYDTTRTDQAPWRDAGVAALGQLGEFLKPGADLGALLQAQPGYQARLGEGVNALDRSASARGSINSGGQMKALTRFGQDYASNEMNNIFNRYASVAGIGQTANNAIGQAGQNYANQAGRNSLYAGDARASGYQNQSQNGTGLVGGLTNIATNLAGQYGGGVQTSPMSAPQSAYIPQAQSPWNPGSFANTPASIPRF
jgi:HAMP domain-containing protein